MSDDIIRAETVNLPVVQPEGDALDIIDKRNALFDRVLAVAVAATNTNDWKDMGNKPYLESSGCEKAARRFGVNIYDVSIEREDLTDDNGRYYLYTVIGKASIGRGYETIEAIGTCSSRDKFFGKDKLVQDVDIANIKKKAYTNFYGNAVRKLLGLNNMTWDMLAKYGIGRGGTVTKVSYDKGASKAAATKKAQVDEGKAKKPFWTSDYQDKKYVNARAGQHFSAEFLLNLGLKAGKKEGLFYTIASDPILAALEEEYIAAEEVLSTKQDGGANE